MLNIKKRKRKFIGIIFLSFCVIFLAVFYLNLESKKESFLKNGLDTNIAGKLLEEIKSPNSKYTMEIKGKDNTLLNEPYIFIEIENVLLGKKVIYIESTDKYKAKWLDNKRIEINGNILNIEEDNLKI